MAREKADESVFYCNYCGEPLTAGAEMFLHLDRHHAKEMHVGPGDYDPGRKKRSKMIGAIGTAAIVAGALATYLLFSAEMDGDKTTLLVLLCLGLAMVLYVFCGYYETKGRKAGDEVLMDLLVDCDICQTRMPFRDLESHTVVHHPEEHLAEKRMDDPVQWAFIVLFGAGIVGLAAAFVWGFVSSDPPHDPYIILVAGSVCAAGIGTALVLFYGRLFYRPRVERLAREWSERHPGSKAK